MYLIDCASSLSSLWTCLLVLQYEILRGWMRDLSFSLTENLHRLNMESAEVLNITIHEQPALPSGLFDTKRTWGRE